MLYETVLHRTLLCTEPKQLIVCRGPKIMSAQETVKAAVIVSVYTGRVKAQLCAGHLNFEK